MKEKIIERALNEILNSIKETEDACKKLDDTIRIFRIVRLKEIDASLHIFLDQFDSGNEIQLRFNEKEGDFHSFKTCEDLKHDKGVKLYAEIKNYIEECEQDKINKLLDYLENLVKEFR